MTKVIWLWFLVSGGLRQFWVSGGEPNSARLERDLVSGFGRRMSIRHSLFVFGGRF